MLFGLELAMSVHKQELQGTIRKAFRCGLPLDTDLPFAFSEMNHKITRYDTSTIKRYLPLLLINEIGEDLEPSFSGTGDHLVYFLDGYLLAQKADAKTSRDLRSIELQLDFQERRFREFGREEAQAIVRWLEEIAYPKYGHLCPKDLHSALEYWKDKASKKD